MKNDKSWVKTLFSRLSSDQRGVNVAQMWRKRGANMAQTWRNLGKIHFNGK